MRPFACCLGRPAEKDGPAECNSRPPCAFFSPRPSAQLQDGLRKRPLVSNFSDAAPRQTRFSELIAEHNGNCKSADSGRRGQTAPSRSALLLTLALLLIVGYCGPLDEVITSAAGVTNGYRDQVLRAKSFLVAGASCMLLLYICFRSIASAVAAKDVSEGEDKREEGNAEVTALLLAAGVPQEAVEGVSALSERIRVPSGTEPLCDALTLLRFYNAREEDVDEAAEMYHDTLRWRSEYGLQRVMQRHGSGVDYSEDGCRLGDPLTWNWHRSSAASPEALFAERHGFWYKLRDPAPDGSPVAVWQSPKCVDYEGLLREDLVDVLEQAFMAHLEDMLQTGRAASLRTGRLVRQRIVLDLSNIDMSLMSYKGVLQQFIRHGKKYFPEVTQSVTVVRAPSLGVFMFRLIKPFLTAVMTRKVSILGDDFEKGLREHAGIELSVLPTFFGGNETSIPQIEKIPVGKGNALRQASPYLKHLERRAL